MAPFDDLKQLWRLQPQAPALPGETAALKQAFRRYGRRHDLIYLCKAIVIATQLVVVLSVLSHRPLAAFGASLAVFSATFFVIADWRKNRAIAQQSFAEPSVPFLRAAIARLQAQRDPFHNREFQIGCGGFWVGCGVLFASVWPLITLPQACLALAIVAAALLASFALSVRIRRKRFERECRPLIDRLEALLLTLEDDRT
jgi:hypothetical protein